MVSVVYCPICGSNLKYQKKCPECGYDVDRDYEIYPTLSTLPLYSQSVKRKRLDYEDKRFEERLQLHVYPKIKELKEQLQKYPQLEMQVEELWELLSTSSTQDNIVEETDNSLQTIFGVEEIEVGSVVHFGHYKKKPVSIFKLFNSNELNYPIEWRVLEIRNKRILLITEQVIDCKPYNKGSKAGFWDSCTLRKWLNTEFWNAAFAEDEKIQIMRNFVENQYNPEYGTPACGPTEESVFLLSIEEAEKYFSSDEDRKSSPSEYAQKVGVYDENSNMYEWWLRSPGIDIGDAAFVDIDGSVDYSGITVNAEGMGVRPAIWIDLDSRLYKSAKSIW